MSNVIDSSAARRPLRLPFSVKAVGVSWRQDVVRALKDGQPLVIRHLPDHPQDPNACAIETTAGEPVGYIPRALAERLAAQEPGLWRGRVVELLAGEKAWGVRVCVVESMATDDRGDEGRPVVADEAVDAGEPARSREEGPVVLARSGRVLGRLVRREDERVVVRSAAGLEVGYPAELVRFPEAV